jgi:arylsulfatase A-like enzyme
MGACEAFVARSFAMNSTGSRLRAAGLAFVSGILAVFHSATVHAAPNIILVMPDDIGYGDYACLGNSIVRTPTVDAFKMESLLFTQFNASPTCAPTRAALLTGRHEFKNGVTHTIFERERLTLKATTIAQVLKSVGYATGIFGKWHLGDEDAYRPERRGFDEVYIHGGGGIGQTFAGSCGDAPGNTNINPALWHNGEWEKTEGYCTDLFFRQAIKWINARRETQQPFFAYIAPNAAHAPLVVPEKHYEQYLDKPGVSEDAAKFFGMIENIDTNFGALLTKLKEWKLEENTLIIYLGSDNGGTVGVKIFNAGLRGSKVTPYEGGVRVPAFWRWPGVIQGGAECNALSAHLDIFPTLVEISGAKLDEEVKKQVEGRSLLPLLKNPHASWPDRMLVTHVGRWPAGHAAEAQYAKCAIRNSRFTLVNNIELYDLQADPSESKNVLGEHPENVAELRKAYDEWWAACLPLLVNEDVVGPKINPMKELYWKQFGGEPDARLLEQMDPAGKFRAPKQ